jgi:hypothetical protein
MKEKNELGSCCSLVTATAAAQRTPKYDLISKQLAEECHGVVGDTRRRLLCRECAIKAREMNMSEVARIDDQFFRIVMHLEISNRRVLLRECNHVSCNRELPWEGSFKLWYEVSQDHF